MFSAMSVNANINIMHPLLISAELLLSIWISPRTCLWSKGLNICHMCQNNVTCTKHINCRSGLRSVIQCIKPYGAFSSCLLLNTLFKKYTFHAPKTETHYRTGKAEFRMLILSYMISSYTVFHSVNGGPIHP